ncbi:alpha/beta hydrolase [Dyella sp. LX-66]|uniref:alpha/beta fold hydrolase n=1 Tax=unclassified Dyella TaxID=2634549 RepID=UPI001BE0CF63|nr:MULTISPECIES: alpha/beta hydrolase [unclassified Dyella]MBT2116096.1 alpha/beta hydrolase [Dyella sp. LX-1]MBT2138106.1 alpha/beta hydrolase [Dyella sp. LX-66]
MRFPGLPLLATLALCAGIASLQAQDAPLPPLDRAAATKIIGDLRRIVAPEGIERHEKVRIGGIDQWVSIRGMDKRNPVLLMIHGGPGWVAMPTSWYFQRGWEDYFTVVQWDQRGAGSTYAANDPAAVAPTMTPERMVADAEEMVAWLRKEFGQDKIFVLGHSWGSYLGLEVARRHPQWLYAYIGVGQVTDMPASEREGWRFDMEEAQKAGDTQAIKELRSIAPYAEGNRPVPLADLQLQRKWLNRYGGMVYGRNGGEAEAAAMALSPEYSDRDVKLVFEAADYSVGKLLGQVLTIDESKVRRLDCPVILLLGRHDHNVSSHLAAAWFEQVQAPSKRLVWFEHSAHEVMIEEPGKTLVSLVQYALPLAAKSGGDTAGEVLDDRSNGR